MTLVVAPLVSGPETREAETEYPHRPAPRRGPAPNRRQHPSDTSTLCRRVDGFTKVLPHPVNT